jgi:hypothetical protein
VTYLYQKLTGLSIRGKRRSTCKRWNALPELKTNKYYSGVEDEQRLEEEERKWGVWWDGVPFYVQQACLLVEAQHMDWQCLALHFPYLFNS